MNQASNQQAFNLITEGLGYLNRVRNVDVRKGPAYLACTINALMGTPDDVEYLSFDCKVVGKQAIECVMLLRGAVDDKRKVLIGFRVGDGKPDFYEFPDRETKQPVQREGIKGRLIQVLWAKIDGVTVDIPLVQRPSDDRPASTPSDESGPGTACGDESRPARSAQVPVAA
jgi:Protein of unknown function (DUF3577)